MSRRKILFLSSTQARPYVDQIIANLPTSEGVVPERWDVDVVEPTDVHWTAVRQSILEASGVILLWAADDEVRVRGERGLGDPQGCPRDNLILEAGLAIGCHGEERVLILAQQSPSMRIPSDLADVQVVWWSLPFSDHLAVLVSKIRDWMPTPPARASQAPGPLPAAPHADDGIILIHAHSALAESDWLREVETQLEDDGALRSEMLYYGPGMARRWIAQANNNGANRQIEATFVRFLQTDGTSCFRGDFERVTVVDLGIGDAKKGEQFINWHHSEIRPKRLDYIAVDLAYDMLVRGLRRIHPGPAVNCLGLHARFSETASLLRQIGEDLVGGPKIFLLLGNTLGNVPNDTVVLNYIAEAMKPGEHLLLEVQIADDLSAEEMAKNFNAEGVREFFIAPFKLLGATVRMEVTVDDVTTDPANSQHFYVSTKFNGPTRLHAINYPISKDQKIRVSMIRKYKHLRTLVEHLEQVDIVAVCTETYSAGPRTFGYVVGVRR